MVRERAPQLLLEGLALCRRHAERMQACERERVGVCSGSGAEHGRNDDDDCARASTHARESSSHGFVLSIQI
jgi:hypothetical protein